MLPTLALIRNEKVVDYVVGFDELGGKDDFKTEALEERLAAADALKLSDGAAAAAAARQRAAGGEAGGGGGGGAIRSGFHYQKGSDDEDSDFD